MGKDTLDNWEKKTSEAERGNSFQKHFEEMRKDTRQ